MQHYYAEMAHLQNLTKADVSSQGYNELPVFNLLKDCSKGGNARA